MGDWASTVSKVHPGEKVYLFTGDAGNALDLLVARATAGISHRYVLRPPFTADDLAITLGTPEETQVLVIRDIDTADEAEWKLLSQYLDRSRVTGASVVLVGSPGSGGKEFRVKISRSKVCVLVDVSDPTGLIGRKSLVQWVAEEWQTTVFAATRACERASYSISALVFATRAFRALSSGHPSEGVGALTMVNLAVPVPATEQAYRALLVRSPQAVEVVRHLTPGQALHLFRLLEAALTDMMLLHPVLSAGLSIKAAADQTGIHLVRVLELAEVSPRYPPGVALRCRQMLSLGFAHVREPEAASTVAILWS